MDENYNVVNHWVRYLFSSQKIPEWDSSALQRNSNFHCAFCGQRLQAGPEVYNTNRTPLMETGPIHRDRSTPPYNEDLARPATRSVLYPESLSSLTLDLLHFLCWVSFLWPSGCEDHGYLGVSVTVCVCLCACVQWTQKKVTSYDMKADSRILSQLEGPQC